MRCLNASKPSLDQRGDVSRRVEGSEVVGVVAPEVVLAAEALWGSMELGFELMGWVTGASPDWRFLDWFFPSIEDRSGRRMAVPIAASRTEETSMTATQPMVGMRAGAAGICACFKGTWVEGAASHNRSGIGECIGF